MFIIVTKCLVGGGGVELKGKRTPPAHGQQCGDYRQRRGDGIRELNGNEENTIKSI